MEEFEEKDTMERLRVKRKLMKDVSDIFEFFSKKIAVYKVCGRNGKKYLNNALREVFKDYRKGVKQINEKIPVYIELPTYKEEGVNMFSKKYDMDNDSVKEVTVTAPVIQKSSNELLKRNNVDFDVLPNEEIE